MRCHTPQKLTNTHCAESTHNHGDYTDITSQNTIKSYAFVFVCQQGRLEIASLLLAASLKRFLRCQHELVALVPTPTEVMGVPDDKTIEMLEQLGVRIEQIDNQLVVDRRFVPDAGALGKRHLITNKMYGLRVPVSAEKRIHIDSGYFCKREFHGDPRFSIPFNARTVYFAGTKNYEGRWHDFYEATETPMPPIRVRIEKRNGLFNYVPPCFNSGFIAVHSELADELADHWFKCWETLELGDLLGEHRYHVGQVSLALAVAKLGVAYEMIDNKRNDLHFQGFKVQRGQAKLRRILTPRCSTLIKSLADDFPYLKQRMAQSPDWTFLIKH